MKKLIVIIIILVIIFVGMLIYKNNLIKNNQISIEEINKIEEYINQIYMWEEVTGEALPVFEEINQANEEWTWQVVKKNIEEEAPTYEQIQEKAKELFGQAFKKEFPKEGSKALSYNTGTNTYTPMEVELDQQIDLYLLNKIEKTKKGYEVEIIEYIEDNSPMLKEEPENFVIIKNLNEEEIGRISGTSEGEGTELVKRNIEKFSKKKIELKKEGDKLYVEKLQNLST